MIVKELIEGDMRTWIRCNKCHSDITKGWPFIDVIDARQRIRVGGGYSDGISDYCADCSNQDEVTPAPTCQNRELTDAEFLVWVADKIAGGFDPFHIQRLLNISTLIENGYKTDDAGVVEAAPTFDLSRFIPQIRSEAYLHRDDLGVPMFWLLMSICNAYDNSMKKK